MAISKFKSRTYKRQNPYQMWWEKTIALLALFNYILVIFNITYIPLRDFWLQGRVQLFNYPLQIPLNGLSNFITQYDAFKGIEPYRSTQQYLEKVEDLDRAINLKGIQQPDPEIESIFADLRDSSVEMIETNPFLIANKTGTLERIKNKMREHIFGNKDDSAKQAWQTFWSREYFLANNPREQLNFFDDEIRPLIASNYYRPVGENGQPVDNFYLIDSFFFLVFFPEFLIRTWFISRRHSGISWFDAMLWRWYDIFLLIPIFRWLRVIPVTIRLNQAKIIDLKAIQRQASQGFVASIAEDITQVVVVRVISQVQESVREGVIQDFLMQQNVREYIDINDINETAEIVKLMLQVIVKKVLPKLEPEAEAFLKYNLDRAILQAPAYQNLQTLPGLEGLQNQLTQELASRIYQVLCEVLNSLLEEDPKFEQLLVELISNFSQTVGSELQAQASMDRLEVLITDLLEEIKINYVQSLSEEDVESILEQTRALRQQRPTVPQIEPSRFN